MASKKLLHRVRQKDSLVREVCDAYAEGVLDGIAAEQLRQRKRPPPHPGSAMHRQIAPNGKTYESLLNTYPPAK